ncbi:MAG: MXAN_5187 C-terminal domain-containing protein [Thermoanaerobaculia bacterium]
MSIEKDFSDFEAAVTRLSREYEVFLYGSRGRLPVESRRQLEGKARALSAQKLDSASDRYRFNSLIGRYNAEVERWDRAVREKEEGRGRFARGVSAPGSRVAAPASVSSAAAPNASPSPSVQGGSEDSADRRLFERFVSAKRGRGEDVGKLSFEKFREQLDRERERLKQRMGHGDWEFDVAADAEKVRLAVRNRKGKGA